MSAVVLSREPGREVLPYRDKAEAFLVAPNGLLLAQDRQTYLMYPGGGVDPGEEPAKAMIREVQEETGYLLTRPVFLGKVEWDWFPAWASTPTRQARYQEYRGERVYLFAGLVSDRRAIVGAHDDAWRGEACMPVDRGLQLALQYAKEDHPNTYPYRVAQEMAIRAAQWAYRLMVRGPKSEG